MFLETISEHLIMIDCQVSVEAPYDPVLRFETKETDIRVSLEFMIPADIAAEHGFSERKELPVPKQEILDEN